MADPDTADPHCPVHEIGLVMAGAVSAGAYTAGVVDLLVEAMDAWQAAVQAGDPRAPAHRLRLTALTGASGGAMNAAILAAILAGRRHRPLADSADPGPRVDDNALFESWVNRIDIDRLLDTDDLTGGEGRLVSLLNGTVLETIAATAIPDGCGGDPRPWAGEGARLALTVTNLRGVPYNLGFDPSRPGRDPHPGHGMRRHADALRFALGQPPAMSSDGAVALGWDGGCSGGWAALRGAALASGAFPLLLPAHELRRDPRDYDRQLWPVPAGSGDRPDLACLKYQPIPAHWGGDGAPASFDFVAVDGGMLDNEPFTLGRELLVGVPPLMPAAPVAGRSLLTIDPFPDVIGFRADEPQPEGLLDLALGLLAAMKNQTRFKPDELVTGPEDRFARRLLLAPSRRIADASTDHPLAGGAVHGFAGFLDRSFRLHDFRLGRLNAQRFCARHFRLPQSHPLFARWASAQRDAWLDEQGRLPILPLFGSAARAQPMPDWPRLAPERLAQLRRLLRRRSAALLPFAIDHLLARSSRPMRWATRVLARWQSHGWVDALVEHIARQLRARGQL
jgi:hypothetical protein